MLKIYDKYGLWKKRAVSTQKNFSLHAFYRYLLIIYVILHNNTESEAFIESAMSHKIDLRQN